MALVPVLDLRPPHNDAGPAQMPSNLEAEQALLGLQLERANAALAAKVQAQQAIIDGLKTQPQSATVKDFNDLNVKVWALTSDVATLKTKLYSHTHSYSSQHVAFHNIKCESSDSSPECVHIDAIKDVPSSTSPPN